MFKKLNIHDIMNIYEANEKYQFIIYHEQKL